MFKLPLMVIYAMIAVNITAFALVLQMDFLIFHAVTLKVIAWIFTLGAWLLTYVYRNKYIKIG